MKIPNLKNSKERYERNNKISQVNKDHVKNFLKSYNVADSTLAKFYDFITYFLERTQDAEKTIKSREDMAGIFEELHKKLGPSGYETVRIVTRRFARWLNEDEVPKSFKAIKKLTKQEKKKLKRVNNPKYETLTWKDGLDIAKETNSIQLKSMILTELAAGLRPEELFNLDYNNAVRDGKFIILKILETKTAEPRDVVIYKAAPYLSRWLDMHPFKKGPLWIMENKLKSSKYRKDGEGLRYTYSAAKKRIKNLAKLAGITKPVFLYNFRHSSISISKQENLSPEMGAEKYGHSIQFYISTYGKLSSEQKAKRFKQHYGEGEVKKEDKPKNLICPICETINEPNKELCGKCGSALSLKVALEKEKKGEKEIKELKETMTQQVNELRSYFKEEFKKQFKKEMGVLNE